MKSMIQNFSKMGFEKPSTIEPNLERRMESIRVGNQRKTEIMKKDTSQGQN